MARLRYFPLLSAAEFQQGCSTLCNRISAGPLHVSLSHEHGEWFMILKRRLDAEAQTRKDAAQWEDEKETEEEDGDDEELQVLPLQRSCWTVEYHILLSPTYQVPVLYFQLLNDGLPASLSDVYDLLVGPAAARGHVQGVGVQGAISQADHPVSGVPYYFVHPCTTEAAMAEWDGVEMGPEEYLMAWVGVVGSAVGLHLPICTAVAGTGYQYE